MKVSQFATASTLAFAFTATLALARPAAAAPTYIALGDSITFGETDLLYVQSFGDRGYVSRFADVLGTRTGTRPNVVNLAIDGETASSFVTNAGRTPPVVGRGDSPLQLENLSYRNSNALSQSAVFSNTVAQQQALGNTVTTISVTLGFNELAALAPMQNTPAAEAAAIAQIPATLAAYRANYATVLTQVRSLVPGADLILLGYYNPFPVNPDSPAAPIFNAGGTALNAVIQGLAAQFGAIFVDNAPSFVGREAALTFQAVQPAGSSVPGPFGGVLPIGNVHPNDAGYDVIASNVAAATAVPEPSAWLLLAGSLAVLGLSRQTLPQLVRSAAVRRH